MQCNRQQKKMSDSNSGLEKVVVYSSADTFVVNQYLVVYINFRGYNRLLFTIYPYYYCGMPAHFEQFCINFKIQNHEYDIHHLKNENKI